MYADEPVTTIQESKLDGTTYDAVWGVQGEEGKVDYKSVGW